MGFEQNKSQILADIKNHFAKLPYQPGTFDIMAVSKTQPAEVIEEALGTGHHLFGENRVQEAAQKWPDLQKKYPDSQLHLIGPLQTNKIKEVIGLFDAIQTLDRQKLADKLAPYFEKGQVNRLKKLYIQINTGHETQKSGITPEQASDFIHYCQHDLSLPIAGLMAIPPVDEATCFHFALLAKIAKKHNLAELSMGMSGDYLEALPFGSTCLRLGTALFGARSKLLPTNL